MIIYGDTWVIERSLLPRYEHAPVSLEGVLIPDEDDIACQFMSQNGDIVDGLDRFTAGGVDGKQGWELVSHDVGPGRYTHTHDFRVSAAGRCRVLSLDFLPGQSLLCIASVGRHSGRMHVSLPIVKQETQAILQTIRSLPEHTITATLRSPRGSSTRTYKGAMLYDYARAAGRMPTRPSLGFGNHYFVVSAEDGFRISLAYFEVTPRATDKQVLLAYEQDGEPLHAGVRLIVPGDDLGGRSITGVVAVELRSVSSMALQEARPSSTSIALGGLLKRPASLSLDDLTRFHAHEIETMPTPRHGGIIVAPRSYTGPLLWDLLEDAGPVVDTTINEDILRKVVVVRSTDGHSAVIATGEIDPRFMAGQVIVATECAGEALADAEGHFRLVVPFDKLVGRTLKSVRSIELVEA